MKKQMKLFQYDKKVWEGGETSRTWQFGILKNHSFLWVNCENPSSQVYPSGGLHILLSFLTSSSLFGVDFQLGKVGLSLNFFTEYFDGWEE
jgi:hypothetical protein